MLTILFALTLAPVFATEPTSTSTSSSSAAEESARLAKEAQEKIEARGTRNTDLDSVTRFDDFCFCGEEGVKLEWKKGKKIVLSVKIYASEGAMLLRLDDVGGDGFVDQVTELPVVDATGASGYGASQKRYEQALACYLISSD